MDRPSGEDHGRDPKRLLVVDCLLPGQLRQLGTKTSYLTKRRPTRTSAATCEIQGGEYVLYDRANRESALQAWSFKAITGDAEAQTYVGEIYEKGMGQPPDYQEARNWYEKAAAQGFTRAKINLGYLYEVGLGVKQDLHTAMTYYREASGMTDGNLEYVSSVEYVQRVAAVERAQGVEIELESLRVSYDEVQRRFNAQRDAVATYRAQIDALKGRIAEQRLILDGNTGDTAQTDGASQDALDRAEGLASELIELHSEQARLAASLAEEQRIAAEVRQALAKNNNQLASQNDEIGDVKARLLQRQAKLQTVEKREASLRAELDRKQIELNRMSAAHATEIKRYEASLAVSGQDANSTRHRLSVLEQELVSKSALLKQQDDILESLRVEIASERATVDVVNADRTNAAYRVGPGIFVDAPPSNVTRGSMVISFNPGIPPEVTGWLESAERVRSFKINDVDQTLGEAGQFLYPYQGEDRIELVAVDIDKFSARAVLTVEHSNESWEAADASERASGDLSSNEDRVTASLLQSVDFGNYRALIIGNEEYQSLPNIPSAANDAHLVETVLAEQFGFRTELMINATQQDLLSAFERLLETLTETDNLVVYYAGHGEIDATGQYGYWLPVDANSDDSSTRVSNESITRMLDVVKARHVLVIADSYYSNTLSVMSVPQRLPNYSAEAQRKWYETVANKKVRTVMTSGADRPIVDEAAEATHSIFATALVEELRKSGRLLETSRLFRNIKTPVVETTRALGLNYQPRYAPMRHAGHEAGEFVFVSKRH